MIKELIIDLAYDKITLSQGLTRAKLIANQVKSEALKNWLIKELKGYEYNDEYLPEYRKVWAEIEIIVEFPYGRIQRFPVILSEDSGSEIIDLVNFHRATEPISIIESNIQLFEKSKGFIQLPSELVQIIGDLYKDQIESYRGIVRSGRRAIGKSQLLNIIELTKQKLIDTLQELENEFPNIDNNYMVNEENNKKVQNIVTNNIYGNNNPLNVASGLSIQQGDVTFSIAVADKEKLKEFGVNDKEIQELEIITKENPKGTTKRKSLIMAWLGKVSASIAAKGLYEKTPELIEFVGELI